MSQKVSVQTTNIEIKNIIDDVIENIFKILLVVPDPPTPKQN